MRRRLLSGASITALAIAVAAAGQPSGGKTYLDKVINGKHMSETTARAAAQLAEFEQKKEPLCLQAASDLLERIDLAKETDAMKRLALRRETLETWLALVALIDRNLDPNFNPQDLPSTGVAPPRVGNVSYPPGADPKVIADPQARQRYEEALKQNTQKAENYRIQTWLKRFDESLSPKAERFVRMSYTTVPGDQREVTETVKKLIKNPQRASALTRAAAPKQ
jgi:lipoprotein-anchoring transpeptidase ErfK/SrfK